ncbi:MAG TPA: hypothetical protein VKS60_23130 [Stellaceae bacterium]|nr:hypothetical protein [Stellaceae bacterium]
MKVLANGKPGWDGDLGAAATLAGPAGIRSDTVRLNMRLQAAPESATAQSACPKTAAGGEE